ncbi:MAG: hypothetical protein RL698_1774 [Pseudomonadota bacterium]
MHRSTRPDSSDTRRRVEPSRPPGVASGRAPVEAGRRAARSVGRGAILGALFLGALTLPAGADPVPPYWSGHGRDAQHSGLSSVAAQSLTRLHWQRKVDLRPAYSGGDLFVHYGSPVITGANTVIVPIRSSARDRFRVQAVRGSDGKALWGLASDYRLPPHSWKPGFSPALSPTGKLWLPGGGGSVLMRTEPDGRGRATRIVFYGAEALRKQRRVHLENVFINTPLTADAQGAVFFGVQITGGTPTGLESVIVRIGDDGAATSVPVAAASGDASITKVAHNAAPAVSPDGHLLYVAVNGGDGLGETPGWLLALDTTTLATIARVRLLDPVSGQHASLSDSGTASPTVGPDGDVFFGVRENPFGFNNGRGWLLHFDATLHPKARQGGFGWDDTASIVPAAMVPSYAGASAYLVMTKYNNYAGYGTGDGVNRLAVLDPGDSMVDPISGATIMREVLTVAGATPDAGHVDLFPNAVREWCINTAAVDPVSKAVFANSEDGKLYRWDMATNTLTESIVLTAGLGEAYTPTVIGPDGTVFAINDAILFAVGD